MNWKGTQFNNSDPNMHLVGRECCTYKSVFFEAQQVPKPTRFQRIYVRRYQKLKESNGLNNYTESKRFFVRLGHVDRRWTNILSQDCLKIGGT